jgi:hypothetical protein
MTETSTHDATQTQGREELRDAIINELVGFEKKVRRAENGVEAWSFPHKQYADAILSLLPRSLPDARPVKVKAKALVWDGVLLDREVASAEPYIGPRYAILAHEDGSFRVRTGRGAGYFDGSRRHKTLQAAKAVCEAQWQRDVLSQLVEGV